MTYDKVKRCLARYSPRTTTTNQPTNREPYEPARPICGQESIFWGGNGRFWAKHPNYFGQKQKHWCPHIRKLLRHLVRIVFWSGMAPNGSERLLVGPKWPKMHFFWQNLAGFGPKIPVSTGGTKSFGIHTAENYLGTSFTLFFVQAGDHVGEKGKYLAKNAKFGQKSIFSGRE